MLFSVLEGEGKCEALFRSSDRAWVAPTLPGGGEDTHSNGYVSRGVGLSARLPRIHVCHL